MQLPALYVKHILPDIQLLNIQQVVMFLVETILLLHVEVFKQPFLWKENILDVHFYMRYSAAD